MMMQRGGTRLAKSILATAGPRLFSTATARTLTNEAASTGSMTGQAVQNKMLLVRAPVVGVRYNTTLTLGEKEQKAEKQAVETGKAGGGDNKDEKGIVSYWGVEPARLTKEDGTEWKWSCFRPWETYRANVSIDLKKHHAPETFLDKMALWTVKSLRWPTDLFFQRCSKCPWDDSIRGQ